MIEDFIILALLVLLSGFFAASEIAFVVANKIKVEIKARKKNIAAENALHFINDPQDFFSVVLIGNNIVNVAFASCHQREPAVVSLADQHLLADIAAVEQRDVRPVVVRQLTRQAAASLAHQDHTLKHTGIVATRDTRHGDHGN